MCRIVIHELGSDKVAGDCVTHNIGWQIMTRSEFDSTLVQHFTETGIITLETVKVP